MTEEIPQWAKERACELANADNVPGCYAWDHGDVCSYSALRALARYIAQHEQPPVDPDLVKAREICARVHKDSGCSIAAGLCRAGEFDERPEVQFALSALKEARNA